MADFYTDQNGVRVPAQMILHMGSGGSGGLLYSRSVIGLDPAAPEEDIDGDGTLDAELTALGI
jgi:hypothetical protein